MFFIKKSVFLVIASVITSMVTGDITVNLIDGLDMYSVRQGDILQLLCVIESAPDDGSFRWQHEISSDNGLLRNISSNMDTRVTIIEELSSNQPSSKLTISDVTRDNGGSYICHYTTLNGEELIGNLVIHVAHIPTPDCFKSVDLVGNLQFALCKTEQAYPNVTVEWANQLNDETIFGSVQYVSGFVDNVLDVARLPVGMDINNLVCVVRNSAYPNDTYTSCDFNEDSEATTTNVRITPEREVTTSSTTQRITSASVTEGQITTSRTTGLITNPTRSHTKLHTDTPAFIDKTTGTSQGLKTSGSSSKLTDVTGTASQTVTTEIPGDEGIFGMTEIIIAAVAGGAGLLVLVIAIICCVRVCRSPRPEKFARTDISYDTSNLSHNSPSNQAFVADTFGSTEYYVLEKMKELDKDDNIENMNNLNNPPVYAAANKTKSKEQSEIVQNSEVPSISLNLYDSITDW